MKTTLKIVGILVVVLLVVIVGGILALPQILSTDYAKSKITEVIEQKTGRKLTIAGDTSFKLYPNIGVSLDDISLSNPPRMKGDPLVKMAALRASLKLVPLFKGKVEVADITLIKPRFILLVDKKGNRNWDFNAATTGSNENSENKASNSSLTLQSVTIKNGFVRYINDRDNMDQTFEAINLTLAQKLSSRAISTKGDLRWHNEKQTFTAKIYNPDKLSAGQPSQVLFKLTSRFTDSQFDGMINLGDQPSIDGSLISRTPSLRKLAKFFGNELPSGDGFGNLKLKTTIKADANKIEFASTQFLFDNMDLVASGSIDLKNDVPHITAKIEADRLDLNPYLGEQDASSTGDTQIDLSGLKAINGEFSLKTSELIYKKARLGQGHFEINLKNGKADITIQSLSMYRGTANGKLVLDGSRSTPVLSADIALQNVLTGAILRDFAGIEKLSGKGSLILDINGNGTNTKELKKTLKGSVKIDLKNGRIDGFNLAKYVENLTGNTVPGSGTGRDGKERTAYDKMTSSLKINKGIARIEKFLLSGKFFKVRASGTINLVKETMRLRVAPRLFSGDWSFAPPLRVTGPWSKPKPKFDAVAFLGGRDSIVRSLTGLARGGSLADSSLLKRRGLQTDEEIESYLAGKKIDPKAGQPVDESQPEENTGTDTDTPGLSFGGAARRR